MKTLTKEKKLEVLEQSLSAFRRNNGRYLCHIICRELYINGHITGEEYDNMPSGALIKMLIPELLKFKPKNKDIGEPWFDMLEGGHFDIESRKKVLRELIQIIETDIKS
jgi:hypothetical protein